MLDAPAVKDVSGVEAAAEMEAGELGEGGGQKRRTGLSKKK